MRVRLAAVAGFVVASPCFWSAPAEAGVIFDQSGVSTADARNISTAVVADDFKLASGATLRSVQAYLIDSAANDNGVLDSLNGTLSWALYDEAIVGVDPEIHQPGSLIATGSAGGAGLVLTDTGINAFDGDIVRAHFNITPPQPLSANTTYWLALHEGPWQSEGDDTAVGWVQSTGSFGTPSVRDLSEVTPGGAWLTNGYDLAFALSDTAIPEPAGLATLLAAPALLRRRRKH